MDLLNITNSKITIAHFNNHPEQDFFVTANELFGVKYYFPVTYKDYCFYLFIPQNVFRGFVI